ncbi:PcsB-like coiled-coil domain-containing protein [Alloiococcus sp. CFN-8]|uniref:PcsB-like coiled-coil domain-containing protein n=1 Tax=Alloiococcus sp. CFN-8 TaxID=3416081 RepID=UPI003CF4DA16
MKKKLLAVITAAVVLLANSSAAYADIEVNKNKLQELESKVYKLEEEIFLLNDEISSVKEELIDNSKEIEGIEEQLQATEGMIKASEESMKDKQALYELKMRQLYKENGQISYLTILFDSKSLGDLISKVSLVSQLLRFDSEIINDFQEEKNKLIQLVDELNNKEAQAKSLKRTNEKKLNSLEEKRKDQRELVKEINLDMEALRLLIAEEENYTASEEIIVDTSISITPNEEDKNNGQVIQDSSQNNENPAEEDDSDNTVDLDKEATSNNDNISETSLGVFKLTAYCSCVKCCGTHSSGTTATGTTPKSNHTISVDPSIIPFGTIVMINGENYVAEDSGGGVKKYHIDIYFDTHEEALAFGVQYAEVYANKK